MSVQKEKIKIAIIGCGRFSKYFVNLFKAHPFVEKVVVCDLIRERAEEYAKTFALQYKNQDSISGKALVEYYGDKMLVQNPPMPPLTQEEMDWVYSLDYE